MVLTLLFEWVVDDSLEMSECGLCKNNRRGADTEEAINGKREEKAVSSSRADNGYR